MTLSIRPARKCEAALALQFIRELAAYEKLTDECVATEAMIDTALFGAIPRVFCDFAEWNGEVVGFAVWYLTFSTFSGKSALGRALIRRGMAVTSATTGDRSDISSCLRLETRRWHSS